MPLERGVAASLTSRRARAERQINPRKSKQFQEKRLGFPWIPLADSGLFNGLRRIQVKKSSLWLQAGGTPPSPRPLRLGAAIGKVIPDPSAIDKKLFVAWCPNGSSFTRRISDTYAAIQVYFIVISGGNGLLSVALAPMRNVEFAGREPIQPETRKEWAASP